MEIGLAYCGEPDAFDAWDVEVQERVLGWWRAKNTPQPAPKRGKTAAEGDAAALSFWGLG